MLDDELADNRDTITDLVAVEDPELLELHGVGAITAAIVLTVWSRPGRIRSEAAFAQMGQRRSPRPRGTPSGTASTAAATDSSTVP